MSSVEGIDVCESPGNIACFSVGKAANGDSLSSSIDVNGLFPLMGSVAIGDLLDDFPSVPVLARLLALGRGYLGDLLVLNTEEDRGRLP